MHPTTCSVVYILIEREALVRSIPVMFSEVARYTPTHGWACRGVPSPARPRAVVSPAANRTRHAEYVLWDVRIRHLCTPDYFRDTSGAKSPHPRPAHETDNVGLLSQNVPPKREASLSWYTKYWCPTMFRLAHNNGNSHGVYISDSRDS